MLWLHTIYLIPIRYTKSPLFRGDVLLGVTMQLPEEDKYNYKREYMESSIAILLAGRLAEELFLGTTTTGASNDLERVTDLARKMVCEWGMSEEMGPLTFGKREEQIFLGREIAQHQDYSESTAIKIDKEVKRIVLEGHCKSQEGSGGKSREPGRSGRSFARV